MTCRRPHIKLTWEQANALAERKRANGRIFRVSLCPDCEQYRVIQVA